MSENDDARLLARLIQLRAFIPQFEAPDFQFGVWETPESSDPDVMVLPFYSLGPVATAFVESCYDLRLFLEDFNWVEWTGSERAQELATNPETVTNASPLELASLLYVLLRQERFVKGSLEAAFNSGLFVEILRRIGVLAGESRK